jgi:hypothetical protein
MCIWPPRIPGFHQDPDVRSCLARSLLAIYRSSLSETPPKSAALGIERPGHWVSPSVRTSMDYPFFPWFSPLKISMGEDNQKLQTLPLLLTKIPHVRCQFYMVGTSPVESGIDELLSCYTLTIPRMHPPRRMVNHLDPCGVVKNWARPRKPLFNHQVPHAQKTHPHGANCGTKGC